MKKSNFKFLDRSSLCRSPHLLLPLAKWGKYLRDNLGKSRKYLEDCGDCHRTVKKLNLNQFYLTSTISCLISYFFSTLVMCQDNS